MSLSLTSSIRGELIDLPPIVIERLEHYFLTYKMVAAANSQIRIQARYGREQAGRVVEAAMADYETLIRG